MEDGSQPIQLCLGIGVGNPRETVDAENNFSKASCQAPPFFFFPHLAALHSSVPYPRTAGSRRRENVGTIRLWIEETTLFSLSLCLLFSPPSLPPNLSLKREYRISRIFVYYRIYLIYFPCFFSFPFPLLFPLFQNGRTKRISDFHSEISLWAYQALLKIPQIRQACRNNAIMSVF